MKSNKKEENDENNAIIIEGRKKQQYWEERVERDCIEYTETSARIKGLYKIDSIAQIKLSSQNPLIQNVYDTIIKDNAHKLLHNHFDHE